MSFALSDPGTNLSKKVNEARDRGIIMTCSAHDEGSRVKPAYPASYREENNEVDSIIVLAACDQYGKLLREAAVQEPDYKFQGNHVFAGVVPFVKSEENITGSSVATAMAAGMCSLILTCDRLAHPGKEYINDARGVSGKTFEKDTRLGMVKKHLDSMIRNVKDKFVLLEMFGGITVPGIGQDIATHAGGLTDRDVPSVDEILHKKFMVSMN